MRLRYLALPAAAAAVMLAGCGSPGPSAPAACRDFAAWLGAQHGGWGNDPSALAGAVSAAPSGQLYSDLSDLQVNIAAAKGSASAAGQTGTDVQIVQGDCSDVNTG